MTSCPEYFPGIGNCGFCTVVTTNPPIHMCGKHHKPLDELPDCPYNLGSVEPETTPEKTEPCDLCSLKMADFEKRLTILERIMANIPPKEPEYAHACCGNCSLYQTCTDHTTKNAVSTSNWCGKWKPATDDQLEARKAEIMHYLDRISALKA